jgi:hypothetical protein
VTTRSWAVYRPLPFDSEPVTYSIILVTDAIPDDDEGMFYSQNILPDKFVNAGGWPFIKAVVEDMTVTLDAHIDRYQASQRDMPANQERNNSE